MLECFYIAQKTGYERPEFDYLIVKDYCELQKLDSILVLGALKQILASVI